MCTVHKRIIIIDRTERNLFAYYTYYREIVESPTVRLHGKLSILTFFGVFL